MKIVDLKTINKVELVIVATVATCGMLLAPRMTLTALIAYQLGKVNSLHGHSGDGEKIRRG